ncbi:isopenicillin N synthase family oxygenase [Acetobacteraceae bacterium H6797]|nr:isopenicillin N synthase family oxygenase [Acetobacteraceae bacterium H6797]
MSERIPTIDFSPFLNGDAAAQAKVASALGETFERYGFVSLIGHGMDLSAIAGAFATAEAFFALPEEEKRLVQDKRNNRGYVPMFDSQEPGKKPSGQEAFSIGHPTRPADPKLQALPFHAVTPIPARPEGFEAALHACYGTMFTLGEQILRAVAMHLGRDPGFFAEMSRETYSNMRIIHYPPKEQVAEVTDVGVRAHVDEGLITLLIQDMNGGLSVQGPGDVWLPVVPDPQAIVVNVGKLLRRWTNGRFNAALHQVVNSSGRERYSIPLFVHPSYNTVIDPMTLVGEAPKGEEFTPIVAGEQVFANFLARRPSWKLEAAV